MKPQTGIHQGAFLAWHCQGDGDEIFIRLWEKGRREGGSFKEEPGDVSRASTTMFRSSQSNIARAELIAGTSFSIRWAVVFFRGRYSEDMKLYVKVPSVCKYKSWIIVHHEFEMLSEITGIFCKVLCFLSILNFSIIHKLGTCFCNNFFAVNSGSHTWENLSTDFFCKVMFNSSSQMKIQIIASGVIPLDTL